MLSEDTQNLLGRILLALAEGERNVEEARKEVSSEDFYDIQVIFRELDANGDNLITPKDLQKYLLSHGLEVNFIELKLLILFYDQDHDFALTYGEIFKIVHPGKEYPRIPRFKQDEQINPKVNEKLYNLLEKEILMARNILAMLDEIKHKRDFNIHSAFHILKYYACITGDSINLFLNKIGMKPTAGDIRAIVRRLDINKKGIIDFCEFHAFLGYPDCSFCCPCHPCPNCGTKYCQNCLQDIPCYLLGCDHIDMNSKMKCTSFEHNPSIGGASSSLCSVRQNLSPSSLQKSKFMSKIEENEKNVDNLSSIGKGTKSNIYGNYGNNNNNQLYPPGSNSNRNGPYFSPGQRGTNRSNFSNISPEKYKLLQGLTNLEQLNKFMTLSGILDRQNSEEINLTNNLSLRLSPIRDFDPKDWGCRNCPCNIHSNPNVPCDCCTCNVCPFKDNNSQNQEKQKQKKFPKNSFYSYSYTYDPDYMGPNTNTSLLSTTLGFNDSTYVNSPKKRNVIFDKESNKYKKTMVNSSDEENEYEDYMRKVNTIKSALGQNNQSYINNSNIINPNQFNKNNNLKNNEEEESYQDNRMYDKNYNEKIDEEEENIRKNNTFLEKTYKRDKNIKDNNRGKSNFNNSKNKNNYRNDNENENNDEDDNNPQVAQGQINPQQQNDTYRSNNQNPNNNFNNNRNGTNNGNIVDSNPNQIGLGGDINDNNEDNQKLDNIDNITTTTIYRNGQKKDKNKSTQSKVDEESEEEITNNKTSLFRSYEELLDDQEKNFIKYLKALIKSEREIEFARRDLMRQEDFNGEDAFRLFEVEGTGVVTKKDMTYGLKLLGIKPTNYQIFLIFNKYDLDGNDFMEYNDFFDMVISYKDEDRKIEEKRKSNRKVGNRRAQIFSQRTRELYKKLFLVIIEEEERLEQLKQKLNINEDVMKKIFYKINEDKDGICNKNEFANYCMRNKICKERKDAYLIFIRLNRNRDGGLENKEFIDEVKSSVITQY